MSTGRTKKLVFLENSDNNFIFVKRVGVKNFVFDCEDKLILLEFHFFVFYYNVSLKFLEIVLIDLIKKMGYTSIQLENLKIVKG